MNEDQIRELLEKLGTGLEDVIDRFGSTSGELTKGKKSIDDFVKSINRQTKSVDKDLRDLALGLKAGTKGYKDQRYLIDKLNDAIEQQLDLAEETSDAQEKELRRAKVREMQEKKLELERQSRYTKVGETLQKSTEDSYKSITKGAGSFITGLQNGGSSAQLAAGIFTTGIDVFSSGLNVAADGAMTAGSALLMLPTPISKVVGGLLMFGGTMLEFISGPGAELAKFGIGVLAKQIDLVVESYDRVLAAGGGFATGLDGLTNAATASFLTVTQFSKVVEQNSQNIAMSGLGFTQAMNRLAAVQKNMGDSSSRVRKQLMNLGYSFEEQSSLVLETMANMREGGRLAGASDAEIERQTMEYAKNLRVIAQITGEDAKKRMAEARTQMQNMFVQQKLLEMRKKDPDAYNKLQAQLAAIGPEYAQAYLQQTFQGVVTNPVDAVLMAQVPEMEKAFGNMNQVLFDASKDATAATKDAGNQLGLVNQGIQKNINVLGVMGQAAMNNVAGTATDVNNKLAPFYARISGLTTEAGTLAEKNVNEAADATGKLTTGMRDAAVAAQQLAIDMQKRLLPLMGKYANVTEKVMHFFEKMIRESGIEERKPGFDGERVTLPPATFPDADKAESLGLVKKMKDGRVVRTEPTFPNAANAPTYPVKKYDSGGTIGKDGLGIVGEKGPELVGGPASVLGRVDTSKVLDSLNNNNIKEIVLHAERGLVENAKLAADNNRIVNQNILEMIERAKGVLPNSNIQQFDTANTPEMLKSRVSGEKAATAQLYQSLNQIYSMMSGLKRGKSGLMYAESDVEEKNPEMWATNYSMGMSAVGISAKLEDMLADLQDPEQRRAKQEENVIPGSLTQDNLSYEAIKELAQHSVRMVEELKRVSSAMQDNNRMTSGILQNTY